MRTAATRTRRPKTTGSILRTTDAPRKPEIGTLRASIGEAGARPAHLREPHRVKPRPLRSATRVNTEELREIAGVGGIVTNESERCNSRVVRRVVGGLTKMALLRNESPLIEDAGEGAKRRASVGPQPRDRPRPRTSEDRIVVRRSATCSCSASVACACDPMKRPSAPLVRRVVIEPRRIAVQLRLRSSLGGAP